MVVVGGSGDIQQESHGSFQEFPQVLTLVIIIQNCIIYLLMF